MEACWHQTNHPEATSAGLTSESPFSCQFLWPFGLLTLTPFVWTKNTIWEKQLWPCEKVINKNVGLVWARMGCVSIYVQVKVKAGKHFSWNRINRIFCEAKRYMSSPGANAVHWMSSKTIMEGVVLICGLFFGQVLLPSAVFTANWNATGILKRSNLCGLIKPKAWSLPQLWFYVTSKFSWQLWSQMVWRRMIIKAEFEIH